jgi:hypothetical protein
MAEVVEVKKPEASKINFNEIIKSQNPKEKDKDKDKSKLNTSANNP